MAHDHEELRVPRTALIAIAVLLATVIALVFGARRADVGIVRMPMADEVDSLMLQFDSHEDTSITVREARTGRVVLTLAPEEAGFVGGVVRGLNRKRKLEGVTGDAPFRLTRWSDGRMSLNDPSTKEVFELDAFGTTNRDRFVSIFRSARSATVSRAETH